ncbi:MAG: bifunctional oligoribonuclease/PAP phosphatase NrnA [Candidatus Omnitrophica bacterium]|nr:bifunctional oligoribonuclease/PAP phosphatase NrnA [Candidatus Omnitrophota bacterium]
MEIPRIKKFLKDHKRFFISAHTSPEGDSLGSQLAFALALKSMGKSFDIINSDRYPQEYAFLPGIDMIRTRPKYKKYDAAIILDCSDISRIGSAVNFLNKGIPILNIDHHISNEYFGDINVVGAKISSACEILYYLFKELKIKISKDMAVCLYAGILTDTGSFRYLNTKASTHMAAYNLLKRGIDAVQIFRNIYESLSFSDLKLINNVLRDLKNDSSGRVVWVKVKENMLKKYKPRMDLSDNILNFMRSIKGVEVSVIFREISNRGRDVRINLRSRGSIDVNKVAQHFGGGGHKTASGITLRSMNIDRAENKVINFIKKELNSLK